MSHSSRRRVALPCIIAFALSACVEGGTMPVTTGAAPSAPVAAAAPSDGSAHAALNGLRAARGLPPATADARLAAVAQAHAEDMARMGQATHTGSNGSTYLQRIAASGHIGCFPVEDVAYGQGSVAQAFADWSASAQHLRNMSLGGPVVYGFGQSGRAYVLIVDRVC